MKQNNAPHQRQSERGNALFLILIAVALFAALSYAVTQSGRGGGTIDREQAMINASQLTQFPSSVRTSVTRMLLTGTAASSIDLTQTGTGTDAVFDSAGGAAVWQSPPSAAMSGSTDWTFKATPTGGAGGWFIAGIGTDDQGDSSRDGFAYLGVTTATCDALNRGLDVTLAAQVTTAVDFTGADSGDPSAQAGGASTGANAGDSAANTLNSNSGEAFACFSNTAGDTGGPYVYYHAIIEQ